MLETHLFHTLELFDSIECHPFIFTLKLVDL
jgi:hypothetical protein